MTLTQFENGYWYQFELKVFAESIGIPSANKLRKDELEKAIVTFLKFGRIQKLSRRNLSRSGVRDYEKGLSLKLTIRNYTATVHLFHDVTIIVHVHEEVLAPLGSCFC